MDRYKESGGSGGQTGGGSGGQGGQGGSGSQGGGGGASDEITIKVKVSKDALRQAVKDAGGTIAK